MGLEPVSGHSQGPRQWPGGSTSHSHGAVNGTAAVVVTAVASSANEQSRESSAPRAPWDERGALPPSGEPQPLATPRLRSPPCGTQATPTDRAAAWGGAARRPSSVSAPPGDCFGIPGGYSVKRHGGGGQGRERQPGPAPGPATLSHAAQPQAAYLGKGPHGQAGKALSTEPGIGKVYVFIYKYIFNTFLLMNEDNNSICFI